LAFIRHVSQSPVSVLVSSVASETCLMTFYKAEVHDWVRNFIFQNDSAQTELAVMLLFMSTGESSLFLQ